MIADTRIRSVFRMETTRTSAWVRLPVMVVLLFAVDIVTSLINTGVSGVPVVGLLTGLATAALAVFCYHRLVRWLEHRSPDELAGSDARKGLSRGMLIGFAMFTVTLLVIALFGGYRIVGLGSFFGFLNAVGLMACVAVAEELVFRGALFRILEEKTGTWGALAASGLVFGLLHLVNPDATLWGAISIAVEAGLLAGAAYAATRSLWLPIGMHLAWNLAEGGIFGTTVSGSDGGPQSLLRAVVSGPQLLTGGQFGPEASLVAILVCGVPTVLFLRLARRRGRIHGRVR